MCIRDSYDIAMKLSRRQQICMIHCGNAGKEWKILHKRLQRIAFLSDNQLTENTAVSYTHLDGLHMWDVLPWKYVLILTVKPLMEPEP